MDTAKRHLKTRLTHETDKADEGEKVQELQHEKRLDELEYYNDVHEGATANSQHCGHSEVENADENIEKQEGLCGARRLEL